MKHRTTIVLAFCLVCLYTHASLEASELQWIGLFNTDLITWLENENRLDELCPNAIQAREHCKQSALKPKAIKLDIRATNPNGHIIGFLEIRSTPGKGLEAFVFKAGASARVKMVPDLFDEDWGYGPYFHQTVLDSRGTSVLLPFDSLKEAGWLDTRQLGPSPEYLSIKEGQIYTIDGQSVIVLSVIERGIMVRFEQPGDMWCDEGEPPVLKRTKTWLIDRHKLYDATGHLKLKIKYTRGC